MSIHVQNNAVGATNLIENQNPEITEVEFVLVSYNEANDTVHVRPSQIYVLQNGRIYKVIVNVGDDASASTKVVFDNADYIAGGTFIPYYNPIDKTFEFYAIYINGLLNNNCPVTDIVSAYIGGGGGEQPTLFSPVVTGDVNLIAWTNNTSNGGFEVTLSAFLDGDTPVTSPLTITSEMDGQTLTIIASADNFTPAIYTVTLGYIAAELPSIYSVADNVTTGRTNYPYAGIYFVNSGDGLFLPENFDFYYDDVKQTITGFPVWSVLPGETDSTVMYMECTTSVRLYGSILMVKPSKVEGFDPNGPNGIYQINTISVAVSLYEDGDLIWTGQADNYYVFMSTSIDTKVGSKYSLIVNVTTK